ncbi:MAG: AtpZ/AtpI family protein [Lachnospiraceae bacterium]|nr:AtpZ/AtpI family protein [Lachnospiraceae bacterium]
MKSGKQPYRNLILISQLSIHMMVPIFMCLFAGIFLDKHLSTEWFTIILLILGILAGGRNAYILAMSSIEREKKEDERARNEEYK